MDQLRLPVPPDVLAEATECIGGLIVGEANGVEAYITGEGAIQVGGPLCVRQGDRPVVVYRHAHDLAP
eukprot:17092-Eustigmatos_ZCMA.PRE.1